MSSNLSKICGSKFLNFLVQTSKKSSIFFADFPLKNLIFFIKINIGFLKKDSTPGNNGDTQFGRVVEVLQIRDSDAESWVIVPVQGLAK